MKPFKVFLTGNVDMVVNNIKPKSMQLINKALKFVYELADTPAHNIIKESWNAAYKHFDLPIYTYTNTLLEAGVDEQIIWRMLQLLIDLNIKVDDAHASSSELSVIIGFLSKELLGTDLHEFRRTVDEITTMRVSMQRNEINKPDISYKENYLELHQTLLGLRKWQRSLVISEECYITIEKEILASNNEVMRNILTSQIPKVWDKLGVRQNTDAIVYYRDLKTFAGDVDIYYWGPKKHEVNMLLTQYLIPLGYKVDHRSHFFVDSVIQNKLGLENMFLGTYLYMYFFMGKYISFNKGSFEDNYYKDVLPAVSIVNMWPSVYKWLLDNSKKMETLYSENLAQYPGFKDQAFRYITAILLGLSVKYKITFTLDFENFIEQLKKHIDIESLEALRNSFYYLNQVRNIYQILTNRRWEMVYPDVIAEIDSIIVKQGGNPIQEEIPIFGKKFRELIIRHLGNLENPSTIRDFSSYQGDTKDLSEESYRSVALLYNKLARNCTS